MSCKSMPFASTGQGKCRFLSIDGSLTFQNIETFRDEMLKATKREASYVINMSGIDECDLAGIQLLYSLFVQFERDEKEFSIQESSPRVDEILVATGITFPDSSCGCLSEGE